MNKPCLQCGEEMFETIHEQFTQTGSYESPLLACECGYTIHPDDYNQNKNNLTQKPMNNTPDSQSENKNGATESTDQSNFLSRSKNIISKIYQFTKTKMKNLKLMVGVFAVALIGIFAIMILHGTTTAQPQAVMSEEDQAKLLEIKQEIGKRDLIIEDNNLRNQLLQQEINELIKAANEIRAKYQAAIAPVAYAETVDIMESNVNEVVEVVAEPATDVDIKKLAYAVAMAETHDCTKGYGAMYNNCFGIKRGSIVPCDTGQNNMCIFGSKDEAYGAFRKIWVEGYDGQYPSYEAAKAWTGNDHPDTWLANVSQYYNQ